MKISIEAIAAATPLGDLDAVWQAWLAGAPPTPPTADDTAGWDCRTRAVAQRLAKELPLETRRATGLVLATTKGNMHEQVQWMRAADAGAAAPAAVVPALPTLGGEAGRIARTMELGGPAYAVSTACTSGIVALIDAAISLRSQESSRMAVFAADEITDFVRDGFRSLRALSPTTCRPFDLRRDGLTLGSAAAGCLLGLGGGASGAACISGWGISSDATHMTAPDPAARGLIRAIRQALAAASLRPDEIDVVLAHATATPYNDAMEALAFEKIFLTGDGAAHAPPAITAVKGLIGHTLGASGLIEANLGVKILQEQVVPQIIGLTAPENRRLDFVTSPRRMRVRHILKTASGFGGMNAAIILSQAGESGSADGGGRQ